MTTWVDTSQLPLEETCKDYWLKSTPAKWSAPPRTHYIISGAGWWSKQAVLRWRLDISSSAASLGQMPFHWVGKTLTSWRLLLAIQSCHYVILHQKDFLSVAQSGLFSTLQAIQWTLSVFRPWVPLGFFLNSQSILNSDINNNTFSNGFFFVFQGENPSRSAMKKIFNLFGNNKAH